MQLVNAAGFRERKIEGEQVRGAIDFTICIEYSLRMMSDHAKASSHTLMRAES
jgi:hypothetical protein